MWGSKILILVPQLILVPYLIGTIGEAQYGVYAMMWPLIISIDQLEITLQQGVVKYSAAFLARGEIKKVNKTISSSFMFSLIVAVLICIIIFTTATIGYKDAPSQIGNCLFVVGVMVFHLQQQVTRLAGSEGSFDFDVVFLDQIPHCLFGLTVKSKTIHRCH